MFDAWWKFNKPIFILFGSFIYCIAWILSYVVWPLRKYVKSFSDNGDVGSALVLSICVSLSIDALIAAVEYGADGQVSLIMLAIMNAVGIPMLFVSLLARDDCRNKTGRGINLQSF